MHANMDTVQQTIKLAVAVGILCLIVVCGVLGATSHYTQKKIVLPLEQTRDHLRKLADLFEKKVYALVQTVMQSAQQIGRSSKDLSSIAEETSEQATNVASAAEQASANVQTVAAAAEELSASVSDILKHVDKASHLANQASDQSVHTQEKVQSLASASQRIDQVLTLIASIAHKTNLLALNATIEAARAGEAGKGFAVVAGEVKTLAVQTSQATQEIAEHIHQIRQATQTTNEALAMVGQTINDINLIQNVVTQSVHAQGEAAREISSNAQEAATGTQTVTANIFGVNRASQKTGDAASDFSIEVERLLDTAVHLRQEVESFMQQVYSAS